MCVATSVVIHGCCHSCQCCGISQTNRFLNNLYLNSVLRILDPNSLRSLSLSLLHLFSFVHLPFTFTSSFRYSFHI
ncbi:hypothetical protein RIF29_42166 [Crotalaria pallida]|uniref:Uncharacterized protein n=1 Tax=Crotalaria pallida TaxID=3830 RepID=A0AAN9EBY7_CROPI